MKRILALFMRDLKVNTRDFLTLYILIVPLLFALLINLFVPSINDKTINLLLIENPNSSAYDYFSQMADVETVASAEAFKDRILKRDQVIGILFEDNEVSINGQSTGIVTQGDESAEMVDYAKLILTLYNHEVDTHAVNAEIHEFGNPSPPLKRILVNVTMLFSVALGGMLIALNIIEEKTQNTLKAIEISPVSRLEFIFGKSLLGLLFPIFGSIVVLLLTGFHAVNYLQVIYILLVSTTLCIMIGFIQGLNNKDIMEAGASMKLLFLPLFMVIPVVELLSDQWQKFFYWNPFYWAYISNNQILLGQAQWPRLLLQGMAIVAIDLVVFALLAPKIKEKL